MGKCPFPRGLGRAPSSPRYLNHLLQPPLKTLLPQTSACPVVPVEGREAGTPTKSHFNPNSIEPAGFLALVVSKEGLLQLMETMLHSGKKVQLGLDCLGDFHKVLNLVRALVGGEGKGHKWSNARNYQQSLSFHDALYTYVW